MFTKKFLYKIQDQLFNLFIIVSWSLIIISALGFYQNTPKYLSDLNYYVSIYICLFLMWRFHPFKSKYEFTDLDRKIAFNAGLFIFTTTALHKYLLNVEEQIKKYL
jgi:hypothetical protein